MTRFGNILTTLLAERKMSALQLGKDSNVQPPLISRWQSGKRTFVSSKDLAAIATNLGRTEKERAEIVAAYLADECDRIGHAGIEILVNGKKPKDLDVKASIRKRLIALAESI